MLRHFAFIAATAAAVFACSSSEEATTTPPDAAPACACTQSGHRYNEARNCLEKPTVIGCAPMPASTGACTYLGVTGCAVTVEGTTRTTWFTSDRAPTWTAPEKCTEAVAAKVQSAPSCAP